MSFLQILLGSAVMIVYLAVVCAVIIGTLVWATEENDRPFLGLVLVGVELTFSVAFMVWVIQYLG